MMNKILGLIALLALGPAHAEPMLWAVTGKGSTVYLFGSVHVLPEGGFAVDGALGEAYEDAEQVCFEIDTSTVDEAEMTAVTLARAVDPEGRDLFTLLGDSSDRVRASAAAAGIDIAPYAPFEPWFAGLTISVMALQHHGYDVEHGVETIIEAIVARDGKPSCGLEEIDEQLAMLDGLSPELQLELLLQSIEEAAEIEQVFAPMLAAWRDGDEQTFARYLNEEFAEYPELAELLIYERNARWVSQVAAMLDGSDDVLLVVGALHLVGERGLPEMLRERGYQVKRL
jgi:uncharacterized protein YbaP (TraB family)